MHRYIKSQNEILQKYRTSSEEDFKRKYKVILNDDGTVFDMIQKKCYDNLSRWAKSIEEMNYEIEY